VLASGRRSSSPVPHHLPSSLGQSLAMVSFPIVSQPPPPTRPRVIVRSRLRAQHVLSPGLSRHRWSLTTRPRVIAGGGGFDSRDEKQRRSIPRCGSSAFREGLAQSKTLVGWTRLPEHHAWKDPRPLLTSWQVVIRYRGEPHDRGKKKGLGVRPPSGTGIGGEFCGRRIVSFLSADRRFRRRWRVCCEESTRPGWADRLQPFENLASGIEGTGRRRYPDGLPLARAHVRWL
jgi:hypothetical protein